MQRVIGLGGIFFTAKDPTTLREWYRRHLGIDVQSWGGCSFPAAGVDENVWCISAEDPTRPAGTPPFTVNYRVADLDALLQALRDEGCAVEEKSESGEYGKFGWVRDPEGHRIELWQPPAA